MLLTALAEEAQVTLLTVGGVGDYGNVDVLGIPGDGCPTRVDEARSVLTEAVRGARPEDIGLPPSPHHFDAVVGSGWTSGREANLVRRAFYPTAITANALHIDPHGLGRALGDAERSGPMEDIHRNVFGESDLVFAPGPKAARDARNLVSRSCPGPVPPVGELIPGVTVPTSTRATTRSGTDFELLMLGRGEDRNKGAVDTARAVRDLRRDGRRVRLTLRGIPSERVATFQAFMDDAAGASGAVRVLSFTEDRSRIEADIDASDALVVASESEAYGLVAAECAARGRPFLVARGNGNGFAELLSEPGGIAGDAGRRFVIEDGGTVSFYGNHMGTGQACAGPRHRVLAQGVAELMDDYEQRTEHVQVLRRSLSAYTPAHMAQAFAEMVRRVMSGNRTSARQGPDGRLLGPAGAIVR